MSRAELEETVAALGVLPVAERLNAAPREYRVLWASCRGERAAAERWFRDVRVAAADDALDFEGRLRGMGRRKGSLLARLGIVEAVARRPLTGSWEGELALHGSAPTQPASSSARTTRSSTTSPSTAPCASRPP